MNFQETPDGTVEGFLHILREVTGRQLVLLPVVGNTLTAHALSFTGLIGAVATLQVFIFSQTFHT
jgi:hypothetical protein